MENAEDDDVNSVVQPAHYSPPFGDCDTQASERNFARSGARVSLCRDYPAMPGSLCRIQAMRSLFQVRLK